MNIFYLSLISWTVIFQNCWLYICHCNKKIVISTSHFTYYMHGQLNLWTDWLRIQKYITTITFSLKPDIHPSISQASSPECLLIYITNARLLACDMDGWISSKFFEPLEIIMLIRAKISSWIVNLNFTVHSCKQTNRHTHVSKTQITFLYNSWMAKLLIVFVCNILQLRDSPSQAAR